MVKSMYSGVTGMKSHQTKMDVIGNNIANVNTYGFKSSRATFRDVYYQNLRNAAAPSATTGGTGPSGVGYGASIGSVDLLMTPSSVTNTGNQMDVAINGDGFFQVMDADGNTFYTRAGMLDIDSEGNLVDMNGYYVLGTNGSPLGKPASSDPINIIGQMGSVPASKSAIEKTINEKLFTVTAGTETTEGNVNIVLNASSSLPVGKRAEAVVGTNNIVVTLNSKESFSSMSDLQEAINTAITEGNGGKAHPAGDFQFSMDPDTFTEALTGDQVVGQNFGYYAGEVKFPPNGIWGFKFLSAGNEFEVNDEMVFEMAVEKVNGEDVFTVTATAGNKVYTGEVKQSQMTSSGKLLLKANGSETDYIEVSYPTYNAVLNKADLQNSPLAWTVDPAFADTAALNAALAAGTLFGGLSGTIPDTVTASDASLNFTAPDTFALTIAGYSQTFKKSDCGKNITLTGGTDPAEITLKLPSYEKLLAAADSGTLVFAASDAIPQENITNSAPSKDLGMNSFKLTGGTAGGAVEMKDLTGIIIGADGVIVANHGIIGQKEVGRIDLANFNNPASLIQSGNSYYAASANSGEAGLAVPGTNGTGTLKTSSLELSNVDLSQEFADMITTQRGFQANSRLITVSDTMLEELVNLKR